MKRYRMFASQLEYFAATLTTVTDPSDVSVLAAASTQSLPPEFGPVEDMIERLAAWSRVRETIGRMATEMSPTGIIGRQQSTMGQLSAMLAERTPGPIRFDPLQFRLYVQRVEAPATTAVSVFSPSIEWKTLLPSTPEQVDDVEDAAKEVLSDPEWRTWIKSATEEIAKQVKDITVGKSVLWVLWVIIFFGLKPYFPNDPASNLAWVLATAATAFVIAVK